MMEIDDLPELIAVASSLTDQLFHEGYRILTNDNDWLEG